MYNGNRENKCWSARRISGCDLARSAAAERVGAATYSGRQLQVEQHGRIGRDDDRGRRRSASAQELGEGEG